MNDRYRRHQTRRHQGTSHNHSRSTSQTHPHGHSSLIYSSNNHHHHPPPTAGSSPTLGHHASSSSSSRSQETSGTRCESSICYSYLVAIISSFLVVLGIYLTMTRFNIRYLYISLVGLLFEAIGACVYCLSNIQTNTSARRKTTINSIDYNNITSRGNNSLLVENTAIHSQNTSIPITNGQQQQQHNNSGGGTYILSNGTLTGRTSIDNVNNNSNSTAIDIEGVQENQNITQNNETTSFQRVIGNRNNDNSLNNLSDRGITDENSITILASVKNGPESATSAQLNQLPKNQSLQTGSARETSDFSSATSLLSHATSLLGQPTGLLGETQDSNNLPLPATEIEVSRISDNNTFSSPTSTPGFSEMSDDHRRVELQPSAPEDRTSKPEITSTPSSNQPPQTGALKNSDLISSDPENQPSCSGGLIISDVTDSAALRRNAARQRQANLRRTLVMGLGGEEEMIEIDEDDLDNMSIVPPSYESIAAESSAVVDRQFVDI